MNENIFFYTVNSHLYKDLLEIKIPFDRYQIDTINALLNLQCEFYILNFTIGKFFVLLQNLMLL